jgi:DNA-binding response OmpR family regulator
MNQSANEPIEFRAGDRILVTDEDPILLHFNVEVLIQHGYEVKAAEDNATAWKEFQTTDYNLLITDYKLLKVASIGLIKKLHATRLALPVFWSQRKSPGINWPNIRGFNLRPRC